MIKRIGMLAGKLGIEPQKLLGGPPVDAEFTEVAEDSIEDML